MKFLLIFIVTLFVLYFTVGIILYAFQRNFIYYPTPVAEHSYQEIAINVDTNINIKTIRINPGKRNAVIYFGGNADSVVNHADSLSYTLPDTTIYLVNYRGYGGSDGFPTEDHLFNDAEVIFEAVKKEHERVSVIGRSLGSGVAVWLASKHPVHRMVLITPFDSALNIAKSAYPIYPIGWMLKDKFLSDEYAREVFIPVQILLADHDLVFPLNFSKNLIRNFSVKPSVHMFDNTDHNNVHQHKNFYHAIRSFLEPEDTLYGNSPVNLPPVTPLQQSRELISARNTQK